MRKRIYELIELSREDDRASRVYDAAMIVLIVLSLVPLAFKQTTPLLEWIDRICVAIVALPSAIVTAGYMKVIEQKLNKLDNESEEETHGKNN